MLQEKVKCYDNHSQQPDQYFRCIDGIDELLRQNSNTLLQKFGAVDVLSKSFKHGFNEYLLGYW